MKLSKLQYRVYNLIKSSIGINTNELRNITKIVDIPATVSQIQKKGYHINSKREKDGTATYSIERPTVNFRIEWDNETNTAKKIYITPNGNFTLE